MLAGSLLSHAAHRYYGRSWFADYAVSALGNRVSKSMIPTHVAVMGMRAMGLPRSVDTHAGPCSGPT